MIPCENLKLFVSSPSRMKGFATFPSRFIFPVKSICCIDFGNTHCSLKSIVTFEI